MIEEYLKHIDDRVNISKTLWNKFHKDYTQKLRWLDLPSNPKSSNPICDEFEDLLIKGRLSAGMQKYLLEELFNTKILQRLDENS
jgi:hypothetical protein